MIESRVEKLNDLRTYAHLAPYFLPLLERRKKDATLRIISAYRSAQDLLGPVAELAILQDIEREILSKCKELEKFDLKGD